MEVVQMVPLRALIHRRNLSILGWLQALIVGSISSKCADSYQDKCPMAMVSWLLSHLRCSCKRRGSEERKRAGKFPTLFIGLCEGGWTARWTSRGDPGRFHCASPFVGPRPRLSLARQALLLGATSCRAARR